MPPRKQRKPKTPKSFGDPTISDGFGVWVPRFIEWLQVHNYSPRTVGNRESYLGFFVEWCSTRSLTKPSEITKPILDRYQRHLFYMRKTNGSPLSFKAQQARLIPIRAFFKWLVREHVLQSNPASEIELPRGGQRLPPPVLTHEEAEAIMVMPDIETPVGLRDRAILEVFYSSGLRRLELAKLRLHDVDLAQETVFVRQGKGDKDRLVPLGSRAAAWVTKYIEDVRPELVLHPDPGWLFLTTTGDILHEDWLTQRVRGYVKSADVGKVGACHLFRHSMATAMLERGADIRYIQAMLGHANLESTQVYTRVALRKLKAIHAATHPGASLKSPTPSSIDEHDHEAHVQELLGVLEAEQTLESDDGESRT